MSNHKKKRHLSLSDLEFTKDELVRLFEVEFQLNSLLVHNLGNALGGARAMSMMLKRRVQEIISQTQANADSSLSLDELRKVLDFSEVVEHSTSTAHEILHALSSYRKGNSTDLFISKPYDIIQGICEIYPQVPIQIGKQAWKSLEITYPENILTGILQELVYNAISNCNNKCSILVNWKMQGSKFQFGLHDNGKGIAPDLGNSFIPYSEIRHTKRAKQKESGLIIADSIIIRSGGVLLFKRSEPLGGTLAFLELPIHAYYKKGQIYDFTRQQNHK